MELDFDPTEYQQREEYEALAEFVASMKTTEAGKAVIVPAQERLAVLSEILHGPVYRGGPF